MMTLGITGRSGCGKSTVTAVFAARGIPLADADQLSREILLPGSPLLPQLAERFGADIIKEDGTLDRRLLADRAFATPEGKAALDALTHPEIVRRIRAAKQAAHGSVKQRGIEIRVCAAKQSNESPVWLLRTPTGRRGGILPFAWLRPRQTGRASHNKKCSAGRWCRSAWAGPGCTAPPPWWCCRSPETERYSAAAAPALFRQ